uniref:Neur_chan_LBD domain-containing protein n=1 Tax=Macrostomum lignano TaxID=282301 RepID=A0A1I8FDT7_9PLAT
SRLQLVASRPLHRSGLNGRQNFLKPAAAEFKLRAADNAQSQYQAARAPMMKLQLHLMHAPAVLAAPVHHHATRAGPVDEERQTYGHGVQKSDTSHRLHEQICASLHPSSILNSISSSTSSAKMLRTGYERTMGLSMLSKLLFAAQACQLADRSSSGQKQRLGREVPREVSSKKALELLLDGGMLMGLISGCAQLRTSESRRAFLKQFMLLRVASESTWSTPIATTWQPSAAPESHRQQPLHKLGNMRPDGFRQPNWSISSRYDNLFPSVRVNMINMEFAIEAGAADANGRIPGCATPGHSAVLVLSQIAESVWKPGVFFKNAKDVLRHDLPSRNFLLWLAVPNGTLQYNQKLNLRFHCHMDVRRFPFDTQACDMDISVFEMHTGDQVLSWSDHFADQSMSIKDSSSLSQFFAPVVTFDSGNAYSEATQRNFSYLSASFQLKRKHSYYILYNYLPSTFIVLSGLVLITQSLALRSKLPRVSYVTTLGIWHIGCIVFVYLSLLEY